jgi:two-component system chemotaxis response regulator CheB
MVPIVVIGASEGGLAPLQRIIAALPVPCAASVFVVVHTGAHPNLLPSLLAGRLPVGFAGDGDVVQPGRIYLAPPDHHMLLEDGHIRVDQRPKVHHTRPAADPLFVSAAEAGQYVLGVVLSGGDGDGALGLLTIKQHGGTALVQLPDEAAKGSMPRAALALDDPEALLTEAIAQRVRAFCAQRVTVP